SSFCATRMARDSWVSPSASHRMWMPPSAVSSIRMITVAMWFTSRVQSDLPEQLGQRNAAQPRLQHQAVHRARSEKAAGLLQLFRRLGDEIARLWVPADGDAVLAKCRDRLAQLALADAGLAGERRGGDAVLTPYVARECLEHLAARAHGS